MTAGADGAPLRTAITFGDDGTPAADAAWRWLTAQAWPGWTVDVIAAGGDRRAARVAPRRCELARLRTISTPLSPETALLEHSGTGLLVIGVGHADDDRAFGPRSMAVSLVGDGAHPVLLAREGGALRSVLVVADGSPQAAAAARVLAELPFAQLAVATVVAVAEADGAGQDRAEELRLILRRAGVRAGTRVLQPGPTVATSRAATVLQAEVSRVAPDLVVIGGRGTGPIARRISGCLPLDVARGARCSVLIGPRHVA